MKKILVYRIGSIGDTVVALPSFWAIRASFPNAHLALLTNGESEDPQKLIAKKILPEGLFDEWISYTGTGLKNTSKLIRQLRNQKFDAVFYLMTRNRDLKRVERDRWFFRLAGIRNQYGFEYLKKNYLTMQPEKPVKEVETELEYLLNCLYFDKLQLLPKGNFKPDLKLTAAEQLKAETWLQENCGHDWREQKLVAVMTASNWESKIWAEENFIEIISRLIKSKNIFPIVFGGGREIEQGNRYLKIWGTGANAAGQLGLRGDCALLEKCSLYLGTDTGTMHLAGAVGIPCVSVFAATDYVGRWTPFGSGHKIFRERVECEGCFAPKCFNNHKCLKLISAESVYQACLEVIENDSAK